MRHRPVLAAIAVTALLLAGCGVSSTDGGSAGEGGGGGGGGGGTATTTTAEGEETTTTEAELPEDADALLTEAVDATLAAQSFTVESEANLSAGVQELSFGASGSVDYDGPVADLTISVDQAGTTQDITIRADGETFWIKAEGAAAPEIPDGKTWLEGDITTLSDADSLNQTGIIGVLLGLRDTDGAEATEGEELDGVATTEVTAEILYQDAVTAAGDQEDEFTSSLSLSADEDPLMDVTVWVGNDGLIRKVAIDVVAQGDVDIDGTYDIVLTDVNQEIPAPDAPPAADTLTGPEAEVLLEELVVD